jgi:hypothetical protein
MKQNGCHNRPPYRSQLKVVDGHWDDGVQRIPKLTQIPYRMTTGCQYTLTTLGQADAGCDGCKHKVSKES